MSRLHSTKLVRVFSVSVRLLAFYCVMLWHIPSRLERRCLSYISTSLLISAANFVTLRLLSHWNDVSIV